MAGGSDFDPCAAGLFALQTSAITLLAFALRSAAGGGLALGDVLAGFAIFWALSPLVIGGAWAYRFWLPGLASGDARLEPSAGAATPT